MTRSMQRDPSELRGVLGVLGPECLDGRMDEEGMERALDRLPPGLGGLEVRADLWPRAEDGLRALEVAARRWPVLFTLRLRAEGGACESDESTRVDVFRAALARGATLLDVELGSDAARILSAESAPILVSRHDFASMPDEATLARWTREGESLRPWGLKFIPTARRLEDACRTLEWVGDGRADGPRRIGFAMGERGVVSRIFSIAFGAPYTYASLATSVAPGQVPAGVLIDRYRVASLSRSTRVFGVAGNPVAHSRSPHLHNPALAAAGLDAVYVPFLLDSLDEVLEARRTLSIGGLSVTIPFKGDAFALATRRDARSEAARASNTLVFESGPARDDGGDELTAIAAYNTDFDGVLGPLRRRLGERLEGLRVAVLGAGGAARGAVAALREAGACPTIYCRSLARGAPVAKELGVEVRELHALRSGDERVVINATSLGLERGDPSPVDPSVFTPSTLAFDMVYEPAETQFLADARERGAGLILGREMLVAQGRVQFRLFTGQDADARVFGAGMAD